MLKVRLEKLTGSFVKGGTHGELDMCVDVDTVCARREHTPLGHKSGAFLSCDFRPTLV